MKPGISIIIPAFNEEGYILSTLDAIEESINFSKTTKKFEYEIIVVDNESNDKTKKILENKEVNVLTESKKSIGAVRNKGVKNAQYEILVFIDADILVPLSLFSEILSNMEDDYCTGGTVDVRYKPKRNAVKIYLKFYKTIGAIFHMSQGATQFVRKDVFDSIGGYSEKYLIGEDVDFFWRLRNFSKKNNGRISHIVSEAVIASTRRFDQWSIFKVLWYTNPVIILLFRNIQSYWEGWYSKPPR